MRGREPLYSTSEAEFCRSRELEKRWVEDNREKIDVVLRWLGPCDSFLDVGCGWGQILGSVAGMVGRTVGVDESPYRIKDARRLCPRAELLVARAEDLGLRDESFDVVLTSQMLHEVKLFGEQGEFERTLREIWRVVKPGGRYFLLDHRDPGQGEVTVSLSQESYSLLEEFGEKFQARSFRYEDDGRGEVKISKRDLQDFVTKIWSLGSPMERIEMKETHTPFSRVELGEVLRKIGLAAEKWLTFENIGKDFERYGVTLIGSEPWNRKFLLIVRRPE